MFDARYFAFATISALLVISPGATMAVVMETVMGEGRLAGLFTVVGINIGNSTLALSSALGMSVIFHAWPWALEAVKIGGAGYLAYLGVRGVWHAWNGRTGSSTRLKPCGDRSHGPAAVPCADRSQGTAHGSHGPADRNDGTADGSHGPSAQPGSGGARARAWLSRGIITNLLNPPVVLFYMTFLPQFIGPRDPFFTRFLVLAGTHVGMSLVWLFCYAFALGVLADRFARPSVRRTLEAVTGVLLVGFGVKLLLR